MPDTLEIKSADGINALEIAGWETDAPSSRFDYLDVTLTAASLRASTQVYNCHYVDGMGSLLSFLQDMAKNWRGWQGEKRWESLEGDLKMIGTSETLGHINIVVELRSGLGDPFAWDVRCNLVLESWQLDVLAGQAKKFFSYG